MTNDQELGLLWRDLTGTYQQLNRTSNKAEKARLTAYADMLRIDYRSLTSTYR